VKVELGERTLDLERIPLDPGLQAFDQADRYALDALGDLLESGTRILIALDSFGALACALAGRSTASCGDSEVARRAQRANEKRNGLDPSPWTDLDSIEGTFDLALVKVPRQSGLLKATLARVRPRLREGARVIGAGMTRHVHNSTVRAFEHWIGPTRTTRARSRARLLFAEVLVDVRPAPPAAEVEVEGEGLSVYVEPGVFAGASVDAGSRLLLPHVPRLKQAGSGTRVVDAGCGNGLLAAVASSRNPDAEVLATDESYLAVRAALRTLAPFPRASARVDDVLSSVADASVDLVLSNPPQHQGAAPSQALLARFVEEAARVLRPSGRTRMVANRHVNLNVALQTSFARVRILDQDRRFMVCEASNPLSAAPRIS
jgi:23S rRNA (guanine1835-N2)-methyltransferase